MPNNFKCLWSPLFKGNVTPDVIFITLFILHMYLLRWYLLYMVKDLLPVRLNEFVIPFEAF